MNMLPKEKNQEPLISIGDRLREIRERSHISQEMLAEKFNISRMTVYRHEHGASIMDIIDLINYCNFYKVSADEILFGQEKVLQDDTFH